MTFLVVFAAQYLYLLVIAIGILFLLFAKSSVKKSMVLLSTVALPISFIIGKLLEHFVMSPRPFMVEHVQPLVAHAAGNSFPSSHTLLTMAVASIIFVYNKKLGIFLAILALLVGIARVISKLHYPQDIMGSIVIAVGITYLSWRVINTKRAQKIIAYYQENLLKL